MKNVTYSQEQIKTVLETLDRLPITGVDNAIKLINIIQILNQPAPVEEDKNENTPKIDEA